MPDRMPDGSAHTPNSGGALPEGNEFRRGEPGAAKPVILVIDDEEDAHTFVRLALSKMGIDADVKSAFSGEQALEQLLPSGDQPAPLRPNVVLLDLRLPGVSGDDVLRLIRANTATAALPMIVQTGNENARVLADAYRAGADAVIAKTADVLEFRRQLGATILKFLVEREPHSHTRRA